MNTNNLNNSSPVVIGEVLFDQFADGTKILGGAPFNVAWNLSGFGCNPLFISAIGNDSDGNQILDKMQRWGMDTSGIAVIDSSPTGQVSVDTSKSEPEYEILADQAYDYIPFENQLIKTKNEGKRFSLIYHGSLICRAATSRETVTKLKQTSDAHVFVDINLREPWYSQEILAQILATAKYLKLSAQELETITNRQIRTSDELVETAQGLHAEYSIDRVWVTAGSEGAYSIRGSKEHHFCQAASVNNFVDSVGAGDAFTSVVMFGLINGWDEDQILGAAVRFAGAVCSIQGATTSDEKFYAKVRSVAAKQPT